MPSTEMKHDENFPKRTSSNSNTEIGKQMLSGLQPLKTYMTFASVMLKGKLESLPEEVRKRIEEDKGYQELEKEWQALRNKEDLKLEELFKHKDMLTEKMLEIAWSPDLERFFEKMLGSVRKEITKPMRGGSANSFKRFIAETQAENLKGGTGNPPIGMN